MSEAHALTEEHDPIMPHLEYPDRKLMDELFPTIEAAEDIEYDDGQQRDSDDVILQGGLRVAEEIRGKMLTDGRRRIDRP